MYVARPKDYLKVRYLSQANSPRVLASTMWAPAQACHLLWPPSPSSFNRVPRRPSPFPNASSALGNIACYGVPSSTTPLQEVAILNPEIHPETAQCPNAHALSKPYTARWISSSSGLSKVRSVATTHDSHGGHRVHAKQGAGCACGHDSTPCRLHRRRLFAPRFSHWHCQEGIMGRLFHNAGLGMLECAAE